MFFVRSDFQESGGTFSANLKSDGAGRIACQVYATSGMVAKTPYRVDFGYTTSDNGWFQPAALSASTKGLVGIASNTIASGCNGWVTVRGKVTDAVAPTASFEGSVGHAVYWAGATGVGATSSAYLGLVHQVGVLMEASVTATTVTDIFLTGNLFAQSF